MPSTTYYSRTKKEKTYYDKMRRAKENNDMISFQKNKELFLEARYNRYEKENFKYTKNRDIAELDEQERKNKENLLRYRKQSFFLLSPGGTQARTIQTSKW